MTQIASVIAFVFSNVLILQSGEGGYTRDKTTVREGGGVIAGFLESIMPRLFIVMT